MSVKYFDFTTPKFFLFRNLSKRLSIPQYHILILAWCARAVLDGESGLSPTPDHSATRRPARLHIVKRLSRTMPEF